MAKWVNKKENILRIQIIAIINKKNLCFKFINMSKRCEIERNIMEILQLNNILMIILIGSNKLKFSHLKICG